MSVQNIYLWFCTSNYCIFDLVVDFYFASVLILSKRLTLQCFMMILNSHTKLQQYLCGERRIFLGGVYMTPGRLSPRSEYTPVPSHGSIFVYMIPPQNVMPARVTSAWVHPGSCTGARISLRYEIWQRYHVNAKRPPVSVWNTGTGNACIMFAILNHTCTFK